MKTSGAGLALIRKWEGLRLVPYKDGAGYPTIGYGHLIVSGEVFTRISAENAEVLLADDLVQTERAVAKLAPQARQSEFDALVSFTFNMGSRRLQVSTLLKLHNAGEDSRLNAAIAFTPWHYVKGTANRGLLRRRLDEAALYLQDA